MSSNLDSVHAQRAGGLKHRWVFTALVIGALVLLGVFGAGYFLLIHYERNAAKHLPEGTSWAVRLDVEKVVLFEPFRRHVLQQLKTDTQSASWLDRFEEAAGVNIGLELREIVYGRTELDWFFVLGGTYGSSELVRSAYDALGTRAGCELTDARRLRCESLGIFSEQASDGVVVIGSSDGVLDSALPQSLRYQQLRLPSEGPGGFALSPSVLETIAKSPLSLVNSSLKRLADVGALYGELSLAEDVQLAVTALPKAQSSLAPLAEQAESLLGGAQTLMSFAPGPDFGGERAVLSRAKVQVSDQGSLVIRSYWKRTEVEQAARSVAGLLRQGL